MTWIWLWERLREMLAGMAGIPRPSPRGAEADRLTWGKAVPIAKTGYSVEAERASRRERLREVCFAIIADPALRPRATCGNCGRPWPADGGNGGCPQCGCRVVDAHGLTFCNYALARVAGVMGCHPLTAQPPMSANCMYNLLASPAGLFRKDTGKRASVHAVRGGFAVAAHPYSGHGHVAVIFPDACKMSGSFARLVPMVANVGANNGIMRASQAFPIEKGEPEYFLWGDV